MTTKVDVDALYAAVDAQRAGAGMSWRQVAKEIGVSPSMLSRIGNGQRPDADVFATLIRWLNMSAEMFMVDDSGPRVASEPDLVAQLAPLLRARQDLNRQDIDYLEEVIRATLRHVQASRGGSG